MNGTPHYHRCLHRHRRTDRNVTRGPDRSEHDESEHDESDYVPSEEFVAAQELLDAQLATSRVKAREAMEALAQVASDEEIRSATGFDMEAWRAEEDSTD